MTLLIPTSQLGTSIPNQAEGNQAPRVRDSAGKGMVKHGSNSHHLFRAKRSHGTGETQLRESDPVVTGSKPPLNGEAEA